MTKYCVPPSIAALMDREGWDCETEFSHIFFKKGSILDLTENIKKYEMVVTILPAPLSDEILKELPTSIKFENYFYCLDFCKISDNEYRVCYSWFHRLATPEFENKSLSQALAEMWIYLKKNGYIKE